MRELEALQARFGSGLGASAADVLEILSGEPEQAGRRFAIYRGNMRANAERALGAAYPVIRKIVGGEFFSGLAMQYQSRFPSVSGDLNQYGDAFAVFLADFPPAKEIPYLADVARLEWLVHAAHYAADPAPFDPARLAMAPPEHQLQLRLRLHPACHVLFSGYPLARIWQVHQEACGGEVEVDFSRGTGSVLVYRPRYRVEVAAIAGAEAAFFAAVRGGQALETAVHAARSRDASFDLGRLLKEWIESSVIVGFNCIGG